MSQIFHRSANTLSRVTIFGAVFALQPPAPRCRARHRLPLLPHLVETSSFAGIPPTKTCMNCHSQIWTNAELLEPVRASYRSGQSLQWTRVNQLARFRLFGSQHCTWMKGVVCNPATVASTRMPLMYQQESLQMEWCVGCHRAPQKDLRPRVQVFNMRYQPPTSGHPVVVDGQSYTDQVELGTALEKNTTLNVRDITSCIHAIDEKTLDYENAHKSDVEPMKMEEQDGRAKREDVCPWQEGQARSRFRPRPDRSGCGIRRLDRKIGAAWKNLPAAPISRKRCTANFPRAHPSGSILFPVAVFSRSWVPRWLWPG